MHEPGRPLQPDPQSIPVSAAARAYILRTRPELAPALQADLVPIGALLAAAPSMIHPIIDTATNFPTSGKWLSMPGRGLGDHLAALLHRLRVDAAVPLLQRCRLLPADCGCPARQARLNALTPHLLTLFHPWPLTIATALAWALFFLLLADPF
jgi:hypothetical protein